eukprot:gene1806-8139_t
MGRSRGRGPKQAKAPKLSHAEQLARCVSDIVAALIVAHEEGKDINLNKLKSDTSKKHKCRSQPRLTDIIAAVPNTHRKALLPKLKCKPVRTASGIAVVAVMCKPHRCPHIAMTGNICVYNPYLQTRHRVEQLQQLGHSVDKVEFIIMGHSSNSVEEAVQYSERSNSKCIGITIETRLEIGVQSVYEDVARDTNRGHTVRAVCESFQGAKDAGFKVVSYV